MPPILRSLPYFDHQTSLSVGGRSVDIVAHQIVLWAAIAPVGSAQPAAGAARFPVVLDTGFSGNFAISPSTLVQWAGVNWQHLPYDPTLQVRYQGIPVPHRRANLWLYPNQYGWRDVVDPLIPPHLLQLNGGIAVYGDGVVVGVAQTAQLIAERLPILGLRAFGPSQLHLRIDAGTRSVWLDSP